MKLRTASSRERPIPRSTLCSPFVTLLPVFPCPERCCLRVTVLCSTGLRAVVVSTLRLAPRDALRMTRGQSGLLFLHCWRLYRGRNAHCWAPPAQIPAGVFHAPGSHLG